MRLTFLGTGGSHGVPAIGCTCSVCRSENPRNHRARSHVFVAAGGNRILIDTPADLRAQALRFNVSRVDAVLLTHEHADHIFGFDDLRRFSVLYGIRIPVFGSPETLRSMRSKFSYIFEDTVWKNTVPQVEFVDVIESFGLNGLTIEPVYVPHGPMKAYGYVLREEGRSLGYFPDCSKVDDALAGSLAGLDIMILDALRKTPHLTHLNLEESIDALQRIGAKRSFITHLSHELEYTEISETLPAGIEMAYDGLVVEC